MLALLVVYRLGFLAQNLLSKGVQGKVRLKLSQENT